MKRLENLPYRFPWSINGDAYFAWVPIELVDDFTENFQEHVFPISHIYLPKEAIKFRITYQVFCLGPSIHCLNQKGIVYTKICGFFNNKTYHYVLDPDKD